MLILHTVSPSFLLWREEGGGGGEERICTGIPEERGEGGKGILSVSSLKMKLQFTL